MTQVHVPGMLSAKTKHRVWSFPHFDTEFPPMWCRLRLRFDLHCDCHMLRFTCPLYGPSGRLAQRGGFEPPSPVSRRRVEAIALRREITALYHRAVRGAGWFSEAFMVGRGGVMPPASRIVTGSENRD